MTPEQIQKMADGLPPHSIGKDHEEVVTHLAKQHIALQQQVNALTAENVVLEKALSDILQPDVAVLERGHRAAAMSAVKTSATDAAIRAAIR